MARARFFNGVGSSPSLNGLSCALEDECQLLESMEGAPGNMFLKWWDYQRDHKLPPSQQAIPVSCWLTNIMVVTFLDPRPLIPVVLGETKHLHWEAVKSQQSSSHQNDNYLDLFQRPRKAARLPVCRAPPSLHVCLHSKDLSIHRVLIWTQEAFVTCSGDPTQVDCMQDKSTNPVLPLRAHALGLKSSF